MDDNNKNKAENSVGYTLGYIFGAVCMVCATVAVVALTVKFMTWLF